MQTHQVPFFSQKSGVDSYWQSRSCGIASLKMLMSYWQSKNKDCISPAITILLEVGLKINAYIPDVGWSHPGLVELSRKFGYGGHNQDLVKLETGQAWKRLTRDLKKYPLIASVHSNFDPQQKDGHLLVVRGITEDTVRIADPLELTGGKGVRDFDLKKFIKAWKKRYIAIYPLQ